MTKTAEFRITLAQLNPTVGDVAGNAAKARAARDKERVTHALQFLISHRRLANLTARLLARRQSLLDLLLGVLGDFVPPRALVSAVLAR